MWRSGLPEAGGPLLSIRGLSKLYAEGPVLDPATPDVAAGEIVMITGPIRARHSPLPPGTHPIQRTTQPAGKRRHIGMVFQRFHLFGHLSALDNVAIGPRLVLGQKPGEARALAVALLDRVKLSDHLAKRPAQLSGGQQQRVAIARALAMR